MVSSPAIFFRYTRDWVCFALVGMEGLGERSGGGEGRIGILFGRRLADGNG